MFYVFKKFTHVQNYTRHLLSFKFLDLGVGMDIFPGFSCLIVFLPMQIAFSYHLLFIYWYLKAFLINDANRFLEFSTVLITYKFDIAPSINAETSLISCTNLVKFW